VYRKYGDLGDVAAEVLEKRVVQPLFRRHLIVMAVQQTFENLAKMAGKGSQEGRRQTLKGLFHNCSPTEATYLTKL